MARPQPPPDALLLVALFGSHRAALDWGRQRVAESWGPIGLASPIWSHTETAYYHQTMGQPLEKQLLVLAEPFLVTELVQRKLQSNAWEEELARGGSFSVPRPINIDPGYLTLHKVVLASAKDRAHRVYLDRGIYAEPCLRFADGKWHPWPWTYPDYRRDDYHAFFTSARKLLKAWRRTHRSDSRGDDVCSDG
ncbi:MAG: GTP-binding protein [Pirellulaceae bacterium]|nr:MAG: GTP-binding protein [Pirellulaceae bacterium]